MGITDTQRDDSEKLPRNDRGVPVIRLECQLQQIECHPSGTVCYAFVMSEAELRVTDVLSREEIARFNTKSDLRGAYTLLFNWGVIALVLALVAWRPNPVTVLVALALIGGRQLGLAVLMHDCGHRALFRSAFLNRFCGRWLAAAPIFSDLDSYFKKHQVHHASAGSEEDPDLENYRHYAVSKASFRRKILRDLTGRTGLRTLYRVFRAGGLRVLWRGLIANAVLLAFFVAIGKPWLYLIWLGAYLTTNMLFSRLRQAAEHAVVPDLYDPDPRLHTRTTLPRWWERLFLAPNQVNFHLEHHLLPSLPAYHLREVHRLLEERGFYQRADIAHGYREVVQRLTVEAKAS